MLRTRHRFAIALVAAALLAPVLAVAANVATKPAAKQAKAAKAVAHRGTRPLYASRNVYHAAPAPRLAQARIAAPGQAGMVVSIDPETGVLGMPSAPDLAGLNLSSDPSVDDSDQGLVQVFHPDGSVTIDLQGRFQEYAVVRIAANGRKVFDCVPTRRDAARLLTTPVPAQALEEK